MSLKLFINVSLFIFFFGIGFCMAQSSTVNEQRFRSVFSEGYTSQNRLPTGAPTNQYWQNRADYHIKAYLDEQKHSISADVEILYVNNSPTTLEFLWLQLDQNIFRSDSRAFLTAAPRRLGGDPFINVTAGYEISSVMVTGSKINLIDYLITDTRMKIRLSSPLQKNASVKLKIKYSFQVPLQGADRMGRMKANDGWIYQIAQWYPRMCVYDDLNGWNTLPYLGKGEFYLDYGNIFYEINAPNDFIVTGSGELLNEAKVLTASERKKLKFAYSSDQTVPISSPEDRAVRGNGKKRLIWKFSCKNTRDVAWAASNAFVWDAARLNLPSGKQRLAMSFYPKESLRDNGWKNSTAFVKGAVEFYSKYLLEYPYSRAINVAGIVPGMEYPGIVFCAAGSTGQSLWDVTSHEFGHTWFPMIVGSDERRHGWMDEGMNTFINQLASSAFDNGRFQDLSSISDMAKLVHTDTIQAIDTPPDFQQSYNFGSLSYYKPALGLRMLRENILGKVRFDHAFKNYVRNWAYKHPSPNDFFRSIENASGEDLSWFWRGWFHETGRCDLAVTSVTDSPLNGKQITVKSVGRLPMPFMLQVTNDRGLVEHIDYPIETWRYGNVKVLSVNIPGKVVKVIIDPNFLTPDFNRTNNIWTPGG
ncbi:M1 family metallopeptidase [Pedobacter frigidisoli]|uniref:M1 family metallopeptidase n=1 Tax=Pedobacter frigidisoli TaxID=2530455 RepID=UPI00292DADD9|nr:M1 family metallopeptidase [Pedobacter frigidisoli]